jgi:hypothetical protein
MSEWAPMSEADILALPVAAEGVDLYTPLLKPGQTLAARDKDGVIWRAGLHDHAWQRMVE